MPLLAVAMSTDDASERLLRVNDVATQLGVRPQTVLRWIREKRLPAIRIGPSPVGQYRVRASTLREFLERGETTNPNEPTNPF